MAFLKRAVAINSIVRVILRMFLTAFRRLTIARALAMERASLSLDVALQIQSQLTF
jgi:hypothetical protein